MKDILKFYLFQASSEGHTDILKLLIQNKAEINVKHKNGSTVLKIGINRKKL